MGRPADGRPRRLVPPDADAMTPDARRASTGAVLFYIGMQLLTCFVVLTHDNFIAAPAREGHPTALVLFVLACVVANVRYYLVCNSSPGYVDASLYALEPGLTRTELDDLVRSKLVCKWCRTYRPIRAKHCHQCGACIRRFDHHCFWVCGCVGEQNHCLFLWFLYAVTAMLGLASVATWESWHIEWGLSVGTNVLRNALPFAAFSVCVSLLFFAGVLALVHTYFALTNQTTWENYRRGRIPYLRELPDHVIPFDEGVVRNLHYFCCLSHSAFPREWQSPLYDPEKAQFSIWSNQYYSCC